MPLAQVAEAWQAADPVIQQQQQQQWQEQQGCRVPPVQVAEQQQGCRVLPARVAEAWQWACGCRLAPALRAAPVTGHVRLRVLGRCVDGELVWGQVLAVSLRCQKTAAWI